MSVVIDASAVLAWQFDEQPERTAQIRQTLQGHMLSPALWPTEIAHALVKAERRGRLAARARGQIARGLAALDVECVPSPGLEPIAHLAARTGLSAYDAEYLYLALQHGAGLLTCDRQLAAAAAREGIPLVAGSVAP